MTRGIAAVPEVARGLALVRPRRSAAFTRFDGNLTVVAPRLLEKSPTAPGNAVSATRLETWAKCPHVYFVKYVLHVSPIERPEETVQLKPIDRGNVVHEVLDHFLGELVGVAGVGRPWSDEHRARLHEILDVAFADVEARGATGRRLLWDRSRRQLHAQLDVFLDYDSAYRLDRDVETIATELSFGRGAGGRRSRSSAPTGGPCASSARSTASIALPTAGSRSSTTRAAPPTGTSSSRPKIRCSAARCSSSRSMRTRRGAALGDAGEEPVDASYWFVLRDLKHPLVGYLVERSVEDALDHDVAGHRRRDRARHLRGASQSPGWKMFVECPYCDPDAMGTTDSHRGWLRKLAAPELADYVELIRGPVPS